VIAFEAARQLTEEGEEVALLALFDTPTPGYPKIISAWSRYRRAAWSILRDLARGKATVTPRQIAEHLGVVWNAVVWDKNVRPWLARVHRIRAASRAGHPPTRIDPAPAPVSPPDPRPDPSLKIVLSEYTPRKIHAPIVHFLANDVLVHDTVLVDRRLGWQDFARRGFETIRVPGDHVSMLSEANAPAFASQVEQVLRARCGTQALAAAGASA
jgi:thioesterase domain-containing protein